MIKNTDPKKLNQSNRGDSAVLRLEDGSTVSCRITDVSRNSARFQWPTGPGKFDYRFCWLPRAQWLDHVTLFPAGCKFLAI